MKDIKYCKYMTEEETAQVNALICGGGDVSYKIDPGTRNGIILRENGKITGFMSADSFNAGDVESAAIADSPGSWEAMAEVLISHASGLFADRILFICDPKDAMVSKKLTEKGLTPLFSEYHMVLEKPLYAPAEIRNVELRPAEQSDLDYITALDMDVFGNAISNVELKSTQVILYNGAPAGKLRIEGERDVFGLHGLIIEGDLHNKGIAYQALTLAINDIMDIPRIYLEVDSENPAAFHLYKKLGFAVNSEFRYYPYILTQGKDTK